MQQSQQSQQSPSFAPLVLSTGPGKLSRNKAAAVWAWAWELGSHLKVRSAPLNSAPLQGRLMPSLPEEPIQGEDCWGGVPSHCRIRSFTHRVPCSQAPRPRGRALGVVGGACFFCCQASASVSGMSGWRPCCRRAASFLFCALSASLLPLLWKDGTLGLLLHGTSVVGFCSEEAASHGWPGVPRGLRSRSQGEEGSQLPLFVLWWICDISLYVRLCDRRN